MAKRKRKTNDLQNTTRTPLKTGGKFRCSGRYADPASLVTPGPTVRAIVLLTSEKCVKYIYHILSINMIVFVYVYRPEVN
jgi:hypothetical protein